MSDEELVLRHEPGLMELVQQIINSPNARDQVEVVKAMLDMRLQLEARAAEKAFNKALHDLQARLEPMEKDGEIRVKGIVRSRFTKSDTMDDVLRPLLTEHGFAFQMTETGIDATGRLVFEATLIHEQGHQTTKRKPLPLDKNEFRSAVQSENSTVSYARRVLLKMLLNLYERDENPELAEPITAEQAKDLNTRIRDVKGNLEIFCKKFGIASLSDLKRVDLPHAIQMIVDKEKLQQEAAHKAPKP